MTFIRQIKNVAIAAVALVALVLPATAQQATQALTSESIIETIKSNGVMRVGLSTFKPWAMRDKKGDLIGFEIDLANKLAADMDVDVEFIPTAWDGIIPSLVGGKFDIIISGMSVKTSRNMTLNFTDPVIYSGLALISNIEMTKGFTLEDYNNENVILSVRRGTTPATTLAELFPKAQLLQFDEEGASTQEVVNGNAHATMGSRPTPALDVASYPDVLEVGLNGREFNPAFEAFAVRKGDFDALNLLNNWIKINTHSGFIQEREEYWFGSQDWKDLVE
jgi:polar amino acid transport system substrate-binding protein